jgi:CSLREA domain-containing protein
MNYRITIDRLISKWMILILFFFCSPILLHAATFTVDSTADTVDVNIGDGLCADNIGKCTLRAAIQEANALAGADTVNIQAGTYWLTILGILENAAAAGDLDITQNLTIIGDSAASVIIDANGIDRVFHIVGYIDVQISNVTIKGGLTDFYDPPETGGGGIFNQGGKLNLKGVIISKNDSGGNDGGGGIYNLDGTLNIENSSLIENNGFFAGGIGSHGISNLTLVDSIISDNIDIGVVIFGGTVTAINTEFSRNLGGMDVLNSAGDMNVKDCTFSGNNGNAALGVGNGTIANSKFINNEVAIHAFFGTTTVRNCTFSGNSGEHYNQGHGTIHCWENSNLTIMNSTIGRNIDFGAITNGDGVNPGGAVILINSTVAENGGGGIINKSGVVNLTNSIVANNSNNDCSSNLVNSLGHNLDSDGSCNLIEPSDLPNTDPLLGEFIDDETPGRGHFPLLNSSPTIDKGNNAACLPTDQLGNPRVDGDGDSVIVCDIGAIEYQGQPALFVDVPTGYWAEAAIYKIYNAGITIGCSQNPLKYCPENTVTRTQAAVFLGRGIHGSSFTPPSAIGIFADVPVSYWAAGWIEQFYNDGITTGCSTSPLRYCPGNNVTRAQMAIFLLRSKHGSSYTPPAATGIFSDVPTTYWAANWIEQLYNEGITTGCGTNPLQYCPENSVTRAQMAVFIMRTFGL